MATSLEQIEALALALPLKERGKLAHRLIVSLDGEPEGTPEEIAIGVKLHQIRLPNKPKPVGPQRQGTLHLYTRLHLVARRIHQSVYRLTTGGVDVVREGLFQMNQPTLARAVAPVLQGGQWNGVCVGHVRAAKMATESNRCRRRPMATNLEQIETLALALPIKERGELIHRLIVSLDGEPEDTPEEIAKAWNEEIARRVADMDAGHTRWIPADEVMARLRAKISEAKANAGQA